MMKKILTFFVLFIFCFSFMYSGLSFADTASVSMFRVNCERNGREPFEGPKTNNLKWEHRISGSIVASPLIGKNDVVFFSTADGIFSGFESEKGTTVFSVSLGKGIFSTPLIYNGYAYIAGGTPSYLYKFDVSTATKRWRILINSKVHSSCLVYKDTLYFGADNGFFYAKDISTNLTEWKWKYEVNSPVYSSPAVLNGKIVFGADNGNLYCVSDKGKLVWEKQLGGEIRATPLIYDGRIYIGSTNGTFYKLDANGNILKQFKTGGAIYSSAGLLSDGSLAFGSYDGYLYVISSDLSLKYKFNAGSKIYSSPCIASDDTIYFGTLDGAVFALSNGNKLFEFDARGSVYSSPVIGLDGTLYFGDSDGWAYAIGSKTGIITVDSNIDDAEYLIEGPKHYYGRGKSYMVRGAPEGAYTITYKDISGYKTPPSETLVLKGNSSIHFHATYEKVSLIKTAIVVTTNLDQATFTISGPETFNGSGKEYTIKNVPAGVYTVTFHDVNGYKTPIAVKKEVEEGIVTFTGEYKELPPPKKVQIVLQIDNPYMVVNGKKEEVDPGRGTKPVIIAKWGRTVVPIRAIVEAIGGKVQWNNKEKKVIILFNDTTIELWIGKNSARVNGKYRLIDADNPDVTPIILNDRTMVPIRFVAETLGCDVKWDPLSKKIIITYTESSG